MWPSGRRRSPAKGVGEESSRGFESLRLRHINILTYCFILINLSIRKRYPQRDEN